MEKVEITAKARDIKTDKLKNLRQQGLLPAVLYGHNVPNQTLVLNQVEFEKALKKAGESTLVNLLVEGKTHPVLIHEVQKHYLTSRPIHVDFYQVSMTEKLKAKVVLEFSGEATAVKNLGGVLVKNLNEVEVECLPADLPHNIVVDISPLKQLNDSILVKNLAAPANVKILTPGDEMVAKVQPPRDVEAELAAPVVEDVSQVEGAAEDQPAEGEAGKEGDKTPKPEKAESKEKKKE